MREKIYGIIEGFINDSNIGLKDIIFVAGCMIMLLTILLLVVLIKQAILIRKYKKFMKGSDARSLEEELRERMNIIDKLDGRLNSIEKNNTHISTKLDEVFQKIGIVKYDAFEEMGGKMSFALALLSDKNTGFVINAMHSREGCYTYIKVIKSGICDLDLSNEEKEALSQAMNKS